MIKQRISTKSLRLLCLFRLFFFETIDNFRFLKSSSLIKFFNLKYFFSLNCEEIKYAKHDRKYLSHL